MNTTQRIEIKRTKKNVNTLFKMFDVLESENIDASIGGLGDTDEGLQIQLPAGGLLRIVWVG
jgi:hypothetical protein